MNAPVGLTALLAQLPAAPLPAIPPEAWPLLGLALLISAGGFYRVVYFISIGYAFSIAAMAGLSAWLFRDSLSALVAVQCALLALYGLRLGGFLVLREFQPSYQRELEDVQQRAVGIGLLRKLLIWVGVGLLYLLMFSPALVNLAALRAGVALGLALPIGLAIMAVGLLVEALADQQKSAFKKHQPGRFCDVGLYRWARCPNYSGEMLFWIGQWVAGIPAYSHWLHWVASLTGLVCIELVMIGSTRRLELKQDARYGADPAYQDYVRRVPVLTPGLPIYSVKNAKVYLG